MATSSIDREMLDALKLGSIHSVVAALDKGANPRLGITFMFKIHKLFESNVSMPIIKVLKERQQQEEEKKNKTLKLSDEVEYINENKAQGLLVDIDGRGSTAPEIGVVDGVDGRSSAIQAVELARRLSQITPSSPDVGPDPTPGHVSESEESGDEPQMTDEEFFAELRARKTKAESEVASTSQFAAQTAGKPLQESSLPVEESIPEGSFLHWYAGKSSKSKCVSKVKAGTSGDFIVRKTGKNTYELVVNDFGKAVQYKIVPTKGILDGKPYLDIVGRKHKNLDDLIQGCRTQLLLGPHSGRLIPLRSGLTVRKR